MREILFLFICILIKCLGDCPQLRHLSSHITEDVLRNLILGKYVESRDTLPPHERVLHVVVDGLPQYQGGVPVVQLPGGDPELAVVSAHVFEGPGVAGVVVVDPVLPLAAQQRDVLAVDHHHVVPAVRHGVVHRLVTTLQHLQHNNMPHLTVSHLTYFNDCM